MVTCARRRDIELPSHTTDEPLFTNIHRQIKRKTRRSTEKSRVVCYDFFRIDWPIANVDGSSLQSGHVASTRAAKGSGKSPGRRALILSITEVRRRILVLRVRAGRTGNPYPLPACNGSPDLERNMSDELNFFVLSFFHNASRPGRRSVEFFFHNRQLASRHHVAHARLPNAWARIRAMSIIVNSGAIDNDRHSRKA